MSINNIVSSVSVGVSQAVVCNDSGTLTGLGYSSSSTAGNLIARDLNANFQSNNIISGYSTTATGGTTTLTAASSQTQYFTGTTGQTVYLPVVSTLILGQTYHIVNQSTGNINVFSSGTDFVVTIYSNSSCIITCVSTSGTGASSWGYQIISSDTSPNLLAEVSVSGTDINNMYADPILLLPTIGLAQYFIDRIDMTFLFSTSQFSAGGDVYAQYGATGSATNSDATQRVAAATFVAFSNTSNTYQLTIPGGFSSNPVNLTSSNNSIGAGVYLTNATGSFTGGADAQILLTVIGSIQQFV